MQLKAFSRWEAESGGAGVVDWIAPRVLNRYQMIQPTFDFHSETCTQSLY